MGRWEAALQHLRQATSLDPRSVTTATVLTTTLVSLRHYTEASQAVDRWIALAPTNLQAIELKAMIRLGQGDLAGATAVIETPPPDVPVTRLVAYFATYSDLFYVLTSEQQTLLLRLPPSEFDDDRGSWGLALAETAALQGDQKRAHLYADSARIAFEEQLRTAPEDAQLHALLGVALAYLGKKAEAIREGERSVTLLPIEKDALNAPYMQHQLVRVYTLVGEPEKAIDHLELLLKIPYNLSPAWLKIDPSFDPLRKNPRFQKLVGG